MNDKVKIKTPKEVVEEGLNRTKKLEIEGQDAKSYTPPPLIEKQIATRKVIIPWPLIILLLLLVIMIFI